MDREPSSRTAPAAPVEESGVGVAGESLVASKYGKWKDFEEDSDWMRKIARLKLYC